MFSGKVNGKRDRVIQRLTQNKGISPRQHFQSPQALNLFWCCISKAQGVLLHTDHSTKTGIQKLTEN